MRVQLFDFTLDNDSLCVTNDNILHSYAGVTYTASAITCKEFTYDLKEVMGEASIQIPFVQAGFLAGVAIQAIEGAVRVSIWEFDTVLQSATLAFRGFINVFKISKAMLDLQCVSFIEHARDNYARLVLTRICNHRLYSPLCGVDITAFTYNGQITGFSPDKTSIDVTGIDLASGYFTFGWIQWQGTFRHITNDTWNGVWRDIDLLHIAPAAWHAGLQIQVVAGCDKLTSTCKSKFNNFVHYMGFPYAPFESIRYTGLRNTDYSRTKK